MNKIKRIIVETYDKIFSTECKASTGDIMHCHGVIENNHFLATTRLLNMEDWFKNKKSY